jgi:hypothetical protein
MKMYYSKYILIFGVMCCLFSCSKKSSLYESIQGTWQTTAVDIDNSGEIPMSVMNDAKTLALATSITFMEDTTYVRTIENNSISQMEIRITGKVEFRDENKMLLTISKYEIKRNGEEWRELTQQEIGSVFETSEYNIDYFQDDEIKITTDGGFNTFIHYTWTKK